MAVTIIAVIGGRQASEKHLAWAEELGRLIASRGAILITGGLTGIMEAASKGARDSGGLVVGVLPTEDISSANPYVTVPIATGLGIGRNIIIARTAHALIAVGGQFGTLSEIAFGLQLGKPVIGLESWKIEGMLEARTPEEAVNLAFERIADVS
ncbi:MAG: TIGR00725 family protein [Nitrospirae bacterium]|nr:MAG: TIGR00725 family protein [Nitrospirota bacterium]